jgi:broad specificity phosphatase PhoE
VGELVGQLLDAPGVRVDAEDLEPELGQLEGDRAAEAAEADDEDLGALRALQARAAAVGAGVVSQ